MSKREKKKAEKMTTKTLFPRALGYALLYDFKHCHYF